jgi:hypothetical protein
VKRDAIESALAKSSCRIVSFISREYNWMMKLVQEWILFFKSYSLLCFLFPLFILYIK